MTLISSYDLSLWSYDLTFASDLTFSSMITLALKLWNQQQQIFSLHDVFFFSHEASPHELLSMHSQNAPWLYCPQHVFLHLHILKSPVVWTQASTRLLLPQLLVSLMTWHPSLVLGRSLPVISQIFAPGVCVSWRSVWTSMMDDVLFHPWLCMCAAALLSTIPPTPSRTVSPLSPLPLYHYLSR